MSWGVRCETSGYPTWRGTDSIVDQWYDTNEVRAFFMRLSFKAASAASGVASLMAFGASHEELMHGRVHFPWWGLGLGGMVAAALSLLLLFACAYWPKPDIFIRRDWKLIVAGSELVFRAGEFSAPLDAYQVSRHGRSWSVHMGEIARVESGLTTDWQPARRYEGGPWHVRDGVNEVPKSEYQTFLLMNDGSRRVIQTTNADREGSATLAQSIRAWLEDHRARTAAMEERSKRGPEGFDV